MTKAYMPLEEVLRGLAVELWCHASGERFWIVADQADAERLMDLEKVGRGSVYSAEEVRRVLTIRDADTVREMHAWKREFDGVVRAVS